MPPVKKKKPAASAAKKKPTSKKAPARKPASKKPSAKKSTPRKPAGKASAAKKSSTGAKKKTTVRRASVSSAKSGGRKRTVLTSRRAPTRAKRPKAPARAAVAENPEALALAKTIAVVALDKKASGVLIFDVRRRGASVGYDYVVLASGDSDRQLSAIAEAVDDVMRPRGRRGSVEMSPDWVLLNYDDVIAHLFSPDKREAYDIEGLWADAPRVAVPR